VNAIAKKLSHKFPEMLDEAERVTRGAIRNVRGVTFGTFEGAALLKSLTEGYRSRQTSLRRGSRVSSPAIPAVRLQQLDLQQFAVRGDYIANAG
jgi:hypothetical protein